MLASSMCDPPVVNFGSAKVAQRNLDDDDLSDSRESNTEYSPT